MDGTNIVDFLRNSVHWFSLQGRRLEKKLTGMLMKVLVVRPHVFYLLVYGTADLEFWDIRKK
jgi:uncharacterized membrane protein